MRKTYSSRIRNRIGWALLSSLLACSYASASDLRDPAFMGEARQAFEGIYSLEYQEAYQELLDLRQRYPDHPAPPLYLATVKWLQELFVRQDLDLDRFLAPGYFAEKTDREMPQEDRKDFLRFIDESRDKSQAMLEKDAGNKDARYFMGAYYGIRASFAITIDHSVKQAFDYGKKAYKYHHALVEEDPAYYDAYMSVGMYEYIVGNLPWYIKWLASIFGYSGSESRGFEYLNKAKEKGSYVATDAAVLQMVLYVREERYKKALENAGRLHRRYPRNYLLHINQAQILEMMGESGRSVETYRQVLQKADAETKNYHRLEANKLRYKVAAKFEQMGEVEKSLEELQVIIDDPGAESSQRVVAHLYAARLLERNDRAGEAAGHYKAVLESENHGNSHRLARRGLQRIG
ncbi:MAG TPA: hypothetical protein VLU25_09670 [Acidobacteriota bacterium]|nr:hypothetical protein [Acidobacteriota bacterium]